MEGRPLGGLNGGESMPWLEPVEAEAAPPASGSAGKILLLMVAGLVLIGALVGGYYYLAADRGIGAGNGEIIPAPPGDYKVRAPDPGGMEVEGEGDAAFPTSEGDVPRASLDLSAVPEAPIVEPKAKGKMPAAGAQIQQPGASNARASTIQLGAFSSEKAASDAWKALAKRFTYLEPLAFSVIPVEQGERTLYRLRASGAGAGALCERLRIAGEACVTLN